VTNPENERLTDLSVRERFILIPLVILIFWVGIYPKPFFDRIEPAVKQVLMQVDKAQNARLNDKFQIMPVNTNLTITTAPAVPPQGEK
jgi:NADH-quinone oxidoreductase subunit M